MNMKKHFYCTYPLLLPAILFAQTFQATIQPVDSAAALNIFLQPTSVLVGKISNISITLAIPISAGPRPNILSVDNSANPFITYTITDAVSQPIGGAMHYIYDILGTGDVVAAASLQNFSATTATVIARVNFRLFPAISSKVKMVNLPNGGNDVNPNAFFGLSMDGADIVNEPAMFYSLPSISSATNDGNGYGGISYVETIKTVETPPAKFTEFSAVENNGNGILNWQMENESAYTDHYEVERSINSIDFKKIISVGTKNNGNSGNRYDTTDLNLSAISAAGLFYYRIKVVDNTGRFIYSETRTIRLNKKNWAVVAYPNPVKDFVNLTIDLDQDAVGSITIYDQAGKKIKMIQLNLLKGVNTKKISMNTLGSGSYLLKIQTPKEIKLIRLVKIN